MNSQVTKLTKSQSFRPSATIGYPKMGAQTINGPSSPKSHERARTGPWRNRNEPDSLRPSCGRVSLRVVINPRPPSLSSPHLSTYRPRQPNPSLDPPFRPPRLQVQIYSSPCPMGDSCPTPRRLARFVLIFEPSLVGRGQIGEMRMRRGLVC